jgi:hypothetical protein
MTSQPLSNPFDMSHYEIMNRGAQACGEGIDTCERLRNAGLAAPEQEALLRQRQQVFQGLKQQFFPDQP